MADVLERKTFAPGERIFREGETGSCAYVIQEGLVEISRGDGDKTHVLGTIGKGGIFGEMALLDNKPRMASARAKETTTTIVVTPMLFEQKLAKTDPFIRGLLKILVENIRSITK